MWDVGVQKVSKLLSPWHKYANARVHLSQHHTHVFPGSFREHCRPNRIPILIPITIPLPSLTHASTGPLPLPLLPPPLQSLPFPSFLFPPLPASPILPRFTSKLARSPGLIDRQVMGQFNLISKINNGSRPSGLLNLFRNSRFSKVATSLVENTIHCLWIHDME